MFGCDLDHATARNALDRGEFVVNVPGRDLLEAALRCGTDPSIHGLDRFSELGLTPIQSTRVGPPRIAKCPAHLKCETEGHRKWGREVAIFGRVVAVTVDRRALEDDVRARYRHLDPVFFIEEGWAAPLASAVEAQETSNAAHLVLQILAVSDLKRAARFYREAFGWPSRVQTPVYVELELPDGWGLGLHSRKDFGRNIGLLPEAVPAGAVAPCELYFYVDDLDAAIARLEKAGARRLAGRMKQDSSDETAYYADPDGNVLVVAQPRSDVVPQGSPGDERRAGSANEPNDGPECAG